MNPNDMKQFKNQINNGQQILDSVNNGKHTQLLQLAIVCLAVVSFFTTAQGMSRYIFSNAAIAYADSAAIQGILLALSMNLPGYLKRIRKAQKLPIFALFFLIILILTFLTMFCSSWFSYVYIADVVHKESWGTDSELLVQQTYRTELYNAYDYAHAYRTYLEESLGREILLLEEQADKITADEELDNINVDWDKERNDYGDTATTAGNYMVTVIDAMETAINNSSSQNSRDLAVKAVTDAQNNINSRMENIQQEMDILNN